MSVFETSGAPRKGTNAQVIAYWREAWPDAMSRAFPRARQAAHRELFPHLASSPDRAPSAPRPPARESRAAPSASRPRLGGHAVSGATAGPTPKSPVGPAEFFDRGQAERGATSPLGNRVW
jgi:hypothetical protein